MTRVTVNHPIFRSVGYDAEDQMMEVSFRDGRLMLYRGVPMAVYDNFMRASHRVDISMEDYYRSVIEGKFPSREIRPARAPA